MLQLFGLYLAATRGAAAGAQAARGAVRGVTRLVGGDVHGALAEAAGDLAAPVVSGANHFSHLGADVYRPVQALTVELRERTVSLLVSPPACLTPRRRHSTPVAMSGST